MAEDLKIDIGINFIERHEDSQYISSIKACDLSDKTKYKVIASGHELPGPIVSSDMRKFEVISHVYTMRSIYDNVNFYVREEK